ncbi:MAG TPA: sigma-70 family RNA polymerase sigma factor [Vicinamibacteria bacterium]
MAGSGTADDGRLPGILEEARRGDGEALGELYRRFSRRVMGLCLHLLASREDAEDAMSEVFFRMREALRRYDGSRPFGPWLYGVATNHCIDRLRRRSREERLFGPDPGGEGLEAAPSPLADLITEERRRAVVLAIAALPERYRVPLVLRYYAEMSYAEIGDRLALTREQVAVGLFRAKGHLRRSLAATEEGAP